MWFFAAALLAQKPPPYSIPFQLRPAAVPNVVRSDTALAFHDERSTVASMLLGSVRVTPSFGLLARFAAVRSEGPTVVANPALGATYLVSLTSELRAAFFLGVALPLGRAAASAGVLPRSAMDNAMFATNYLTCFPGASVAWVARGLTVQAEATVLALLRAKGEDERARVNLTTGLHVGYFVVPALSLGAELRYQRFLKNDALAGKPALDNLTVAAGVRGHFQLGDTTWFRPAQRDVKRMEARVDVVRDVGLTIRRAATGADRGRPRTRRREGTRAASRAVDDERARGERQEHAPRFGVGPRIGPCVGSLDDDVPARLGIDPEVRRAAGGRVEPVEKPAAAAVVAQAQQRIPRAARVGDRTAPVTVVVRERAVECGEDRRHHRIHRRAPRGGGLRIRRRARPTGDVGDQLRIQRGERAKRARVPALARHGGLQPLGAGVGRIVVGPASHERGRREQSETLTFASQWFHAAPARRSSKRGAVSGAWLRCHGSQSTRLRARSPRLATLVDAAVAVVVDPVARLE